MAEEAGVDRAAAMAEAYRRGLLKGEMLDAYEEAVKRGLVSAPAPAGFTDPNAKPLNVPTDQNLTAGPKELTGVPRFAAMTANALTKGLAQGAGLPGTLAELGRTWIENPIRSLVGAPQAEPGFLPTMDSAGDWADRNLRIPGTDLERSELERNYSSGLQGGAAAVPASMLLPGGGMIGKTLSGAAGGVVADAAHRAWPESNLAPVLLSSAAGVGTQAAGRLTSPKSIASWARRHGPAESFEDAGTGLQDSARAWIHGRMPALEERAWDAVNAKVPGTASTNMDELRGAVRSVLGTGGNIEDLKRSFSPSLVRRLQTFLEPSTSTVKTKAGPITTTKPPATPTWEEAREIRSELGEALHNPSIVRDLGEGKLSKLYAAITEDLEKVASKHGASLEFSSANQTSRDLHDFAENIIGKIIKDRDGGLADLPGKVAKSLVSAGSTDSKHLAALRAEFPQQVDNLTAAMLRENPEAWAKLSQKAKEALAPEHHMGISEAVNRSKISPWDPATLGVFGLLAGEFGPHAAAAINNTLGAGTVDVHKAALLGNALPWAVLGLRNAAKNPLVVRGAVAGQVGGEATRK